MEINNMEYFLTQRGNHVLLHQGYEYTKYRENSSGVVTWRCRVYFATNCKAFLKTKEENIIGEAPQHCHDSNPQKAQANILRTRMKQEMKAVGASPKEVMENILSKVKVEVLEHLPKPSSLTRNLFKHKETTYMLSNPTTTDFLIPDTFADLILFDTGADDPERILVVGNEELISELNKDVIYGDGTFDETPALFYQLFTWHAKIGSAYPPCIYFLLQNKNFDSYNRMFMILNQLVPNLTPKTIYVDFEKPCMVAAQLAFPEAEVKGYYFHLCQSIIKKVGSVGLKQLYESDIDTKLQLKSLAALSLVPPEDVKTVFNQLAATFPDEENYNEVLTYFNSTFIEGVIGRLPTFPISVWNLLETTAEGCTKSINCEDFHNTLNSLFHCSHPSFWNLLDGLRRNIGCQRLLLVNAQSGQPEVKKKKCEALSKQLAIAVQDYRNQEDKLQFLRKIANLH